MFALEIIFQFCQLFVLYLQGHRSVTSVKLPRAVVLPYLKILLVNPSYLLTLLLGLPGSRVTLPPCKQGLRDFPQTKLDGEINSPFLLTSRVTHEFC